MGEEENVCEHTSCICVSDQRRAKKKREGKSNDDELSPFEVRKRCENLRVGRGSQGSG